MNQVLGSIFLFIIIIALAIGMFIGFKKLKKLIFKRKTQ